MYHTIPGLKDKFEEYLLGYNIDVRTITRTVAGGEKLVTAAVWSDAGDLIDTATNARVFPVSHPDTTTDSEFQVCYLFVCMQVYVC